MRIVLAPDAFKGTLMQEEVVKIMKKALQSMQPTSEIIEKPMADGGEGSLAVLKRAYPYQRKISLSVTGPSGNKINTYFFIVDEHTALIEVANVIGLSLLSEEKLNPWNTTTYGLGEILLKGLDLGVKHFLITLGGSATNDGGFGMFQALGVQFLSKNHRILSKYTRDFLHVSKIDSSAFNERFHDCTFTLISDVTNPLYGQDGATFIFGPQKGVKDTELFLLDQAMKTYADSMVATFEVPKSTPMMKGAGAAGGLGFSLLVLGGKMERGAKYIAKKTQLEKAIKDADVVFTGEGKSDATTLKGKAPIHVAQLAKRYGVPCFLISGMVEDRALLEQNFTKIYSLVDEKTNLKKALEHPQKVLYQKMLTIVKEMIV